MKPNRINCQKGSTAVVKKDKTITLTRTPGAWPNPRFEKILEEGYLVEILSAPKKYFGIANCIHLKLSDTNQEGYVYWVDFIKFFEMQTIVPGDDVPRSRAEKLANKKNRLAEPGYYVEYLVDVGGEIQNPNYMEGEHAMVICIGEDATAKAVRYASQDSWSTLLWSCAPTRKFMETTNNVPQATPQKRVESRYQYFATHQELVNCARPIADFARQNKSPNDTFSPE